MNGEEDPIEVLFVARFGAAELIGIRWPILPHRERTVSYVNGMPRAADGGEPRPADPRCVGRVRRLRAAPFDYAVRSEHMSYVPCDEPIPYISCVKTVSVCSEGYYESAR